MRLLSYVTQAHGLFLALAALFISALPASADPNLGSRKLGEFNDPVYVTAAPGQPNLLFVVERAGRIWVLQNGQKLAEPFLDINGIVRGKPDPDAGGEQGLLSIAFPASYPTSGRFYVFYTDLTGEIEIDEFQRSKANPVMADSQSRRPVIRVQHPPATNHNGGQLQFDGSGLLYISIGDGGGAEPRGENARRLDVLLGKVLRINPRQSGTARYTIPADNPFVGKPGRDEIFAYGLRNPWRFSINSQIISISDVGQAKREEVNILTLAEAKGANLGWPEYEGTLVYDATRPGPHPPKSPLFQYAQTDGRCAIIGGYIVRGDVLPEFQGRYIFGDACTGEIRSFFPRVAEQKAYNNQPTGLTISRLTSFGRGLDGAIYATQNGNPGAVYQLVPAP